MITVWAAAIAVLLKKDMLKSPMSRGEGRSCRPRPVFATARTEHKDRLGPVHIPPRYRINFEAGIERRRKHLLT
jgi:hypothetical protein